MPTVWRDCGHDSADLVWLIYIRASGMWPMSSCRYASASRCRRGQATPRLAQVLGCLERIGFRGLRECHGGLVIALPGYGQRLLDELGVPGMARGGVADSNRGAARRALRLRGLCAVGLGWSGRAEITSAPRSSRSQRSVLFALFQPTGGAIAFRRGDGPPRTCGPSPGTWPTRVIWSLPAGSVSSSGLPSPYPRGSEDGHRCDS